MFHVGKNLEPHHKQYCLYTTMPKLGHLTETENCVSKFITRHSHKCWCPTLLVFNRGARHLQVHVRNSGKSMTDTIMEQRAFGRSRKGLVFFFLLYKHYRNLKGQAIEAGTPGTI